MLTECDGKTRLMSLETKQKISKSLTGKERSLETRRKISAFQQQHKDKNQYWKGRNRSDNEKDSISKGMIGINANENNPMWGKTGSLNPSSKIVLNLETGIFYESGVEAARSIGIKYTKFRKIITGQNINRTSLVHV